MQRSTRREPLQQHTPPGRSRRTSRPRSSSASLTGHSSSRTVWRVVVRSERDNRDPGQRFIAVISRRHQLPSITPGRRSSVDVLSKGEGVKALPTGARQCCLNRRQRMEPLWSPVVATGGNQRQIDRAQEWRKQAKSVATGCHRLPETFHGKEGVDGSSPSEGSAKVPHNGAFFSDRLAGSRTWGRYGALYGAFRSKTRSLSAGSLTTVRFRRRPNGAPRGSGSHPGPTISITD